MIRRGLMNIGWLSPYVGVLVNFATVLVMGSVGALIKKGIPKRFSDAIMSAMAICVIYIGVEGALETAPDTSEVAPLLSAGLFKILVMTVSMAIGTLIGELIDIEKQMDRLGNFASKKLGAIGKNENFSKGFVSCTILFCVGAMAVNGSISSAMGDHQLLLAKSVIDGVTVFVMASSLGIGCAFAAFPVLIYQGLLTLFGTSLVEVLSASSLTYMSVTGSLIVILIGTNVLGITKVRTANMIPSMFVAFGIEALLGWIF